MGEIALPVFDWTRRCRCGLGATHVCTEGRFLDGTRLSNLMSYRPDWRWYACGDKAHQATDGNGRRVGEVLSVAEYDDLVANWDARWLRDRQQKEAAAVLLDAEAEREAMEEA